MVEEQADAAAEEGVNLKRAGEMPHHLARNREATTRPEPSAEEKPAWEGMALYLASAAESP